MEINIENLKFCIQNRWDKFILKENLDSSYYKIKEFKKIIDIGAHIGGTSILAASLGSRVYAYEPEDKNFNLLKKNVQLNGFENNIQCNQVAIGKTGKRNLFVNSISSGSHTFFKEKEIVFQRGYNNIQKVKSINLREALGNKSIDLLKIDCEGAEYEIIPEIDKEMSSRIKQISMELHKGDFKKIINHLNKYYILEISKPYKNLPLLKIIAFRK